VLGGATKRGFSRGKRKQVWSEREENASREGKKAGSLLTYLVREKRKGTLRMSSATRSKNKSSKRKAGKGHPVSRGKGKRSPPSRKDPGRLL